MNSTRLTGDTAITTMIRGGSVQDTVTDNSTSINNRNDNNQEEEEAFAEPMIKSVSCVASQDVGPRDIQHLRGDRSRIVGANTLRRLAKDHLATILWRSSSILKALTLETTGLRT